ncbi:MAG: hypothetical protein KC800_05070 [Candidatus Eremiobacteraeota bacterium]|nr:hypothetical protein [Candidatus Eremiobacteraeota bacterium]
MKSLLAAIMIATTLGSSPQIEEPAVHQHDGCSHVQTVEVYEVAQASVFKAVCSKGDLNATYQNRSDAVKAAEAHQKATGHKTSVRKQ